MEPQNTQQPQAPQSELKKAYDEFVQMVQGLPDTVKEKAKIMSLMEKVTALVDAVKPEDVQQTEPEDDMPDMGTKRDPMKEIMDASQQEYKPA